MNASKCTKKNEEPAKQLNSHEKTQEEPGDVQDLNNGKDWHKL